MPRNNNNKAIRTPNNKSLHYKNNINMQNHHNQVLSNIRLTLVALLLTSSAFISNPLYAQGVFAGVDIENKAVVNYSIAGEVQSPIESSPNGNRSPGLGGGRFTHFKVDRKVDLSITNNGNTDVTPGETQAELSFTLSNDGNDIQEFTLIPDGVISGDNFDSNNCKISVTAVTGTLLSGVVLPSHDKIKLSPDQQASISVKCDIPFDNKGQIISQNHTSTLSVRATASANQDGSPTLEESTADSSDGVDTVFTDGAGTDDAQRDASHSTRGTYIAQASTPLPTLSIKKSILEVVDSEGGNKANSGSKVTYKITISTTGVGIVNNVVITDPTPADMTYKQGSITLNSTKLTDSSDADKGSFDATSNISTINLGDITAGDQQVITLSYTIN